MSTLRDRRHLARVLEEELGFYRQMFVLMDRQRDSLRQGLTHDLSDDFAGIQDLRQRIEESETLIASARQAQKSAFDDWARTPEITELFEKITTIVGRCHKVALECERLTREQLDAYRHEFGQMAGGRRLLAGMALIDDQPRFIDQRP